MILRPENSDVNFFLQILKEQGQRILIKIFLTKFTSYFYNFTYFMTVQL